MKAVIPVRQGALPEGAEAVARLAVGLVVIGEGTAGALAELQDLCGNKLAAHSLELGPYAPSHYAEQLARLLGEESRVIFPASPDGRHLAPRLAARLGWPLVAGALVLGEHKASLVRNGGRRLVEVALPKRAVVTLESTGQDRSRRNEPGTRFPARLVEAAAPPGDPVFQELLPADPAALDLSEADRILVAGAGLSADSIARLFLAGEQLSASVGATRVVTDAGQMDHRRQIGTTGVSVSPRLYVAFGVSGAAQHVAGLGDPEHVISVNTDPSCPMMAMADLAVVSDASATLEALVSLLAERGSDG